MIDLFKKDLRIQLSSIEDSININNYNVEQLCLLSFLILEEKNGEISIDDLCKRIVDSVNGDIDAIKARIIAVFVINKFETYTKLRKSDRLTYLTNSVKSDKATNEQYVQTDTQLKSKKVVDGRHENSSRDNVNNNPSLHKTAKSSRDTSSPKEDNEQLSSKNKHDNNINEHKDKSGLITFLGVLFTSISLCYLLDLRWGYTFSILFFMFMLYSCINSIFKNKADKVNMYFFGVTGVALTLTSLIVMFSFSDFNYEKSCSID